MTAARSIIPSPAHKAGDQLHGFVIESVTPIPDIKALAYRARHSKTGAEVLAVHANDEENLFSVGFRTPPPDSTGVAHILEHCVLAGSKQFPVKDAFNELGKRTLSTFLNAMTWPDRTIYPTCSAVRADYFNLAKVYSDLVFNPLISQQTFQQEGHHFELEDLEDKASALKVTGVVYNEMKGAYSSPEQVVYRGMQQALLPDTPYGVDSGGDPEVIPDLTYENFVAFHRRFYSPSNARFMLYGDVPLAENLAFLEGVLRPFDKVEVKSELPLQPRWSEPRKSSLEYPVGSDDDLKGKTFITVTWLANETANAMESLLLEIALGALSGTAAGPMRKALIDSGLGKDIFPGGAYEADLRQAFIAFGLRGTDADKADAIEKLILDTLNQVVEAGLDKGLIEASFHQIELGGKEIVPPFPIMLLIRANPTWYFGGDPQDGLRFSTLVEQARKKWEAEPGLFEGLIRKWLIDNPHRLRLVCTPSNTLSAKKDEEFAARMKAEKSAMKPEQVDAIVSTAKALQQMQETPDSPEAINSLPKLAVTDIPKSPREVPEKRADIGATPVFTHEVFSNGIGYVGLAFDTRDLDDNLAQWLPILGKATLGMGAAGLNYEQMATRIASKTGGFGAAPMAGRNIHTGELYERFAIDGKVIARNSAELFGVLKDVLLAPDTTDHKRLRDLLRESASRMSSRIIPAGHMFAFLRAAASLDHPLWRREQWEGVTQVRFLNDLGSGDHAERAAAQIHALQKQLFTRSRVMVNVAGDPEVLDTLRGPLEAFLSALPAGEPVTKREPGKPKISAASGVIIPAQVNYVGQCLPMPNLTSAEAPALELLSQILSSDFLYKKLRVQGGAYGGFCFYVKEAGLLPMLSYRDPNLEKTFAVYTQVVDFLKSDALNDEAVEANRIGAIGSFDRILSPAQQMAAAREHFLRGVTMEDRTKFRSGLLGVTAAQIRDAALPHVEKALATAPRAALGSKERLEKANAEAKAGLELFNPEAGR